MLSGLLKGNITRPRIPFFASFAKIPKAKNETFHSLDGNSIVYNAKENQEYGNHIEMSGFYCSSIISYGHDNIGCLKIMRHTVFPTLRMYPNKTHSSQDHNFCGVTFEVDNKKLDEKVKRFIFNGILTIETVIGDISVKRELFTAPDAPCLVEKITVKNDSEKSVTVSCINKDKEFVTPKRYGHERKQYKLYCTVNENEFELKSGASKTFFACYCGTNLETPTLKVEGEKQLQMRLDMIADLDGKMVVKTPDDTINAMCRFAKIRACESIYKTKNGLMHSPGGGGYYAALWTNDQCEYVNPLFGYLGYKTGFEQSVNCYNLYKKYISPDKALITSIISEGDGIWHGAKDRGDSAMYAYGASRFVLSSGDENLADEFIDAIKDCADFTVSQINENNVVASDSDELENRFESGKANLTTSCIAYDALLSFSYILEEKGRNSDAEFYRNQAQVIRDGIKNYFEANVEGYDTYRYCKEEKRLRSWICMPLTVGIFDKAKGTADALFSDKLRMEEGLVTRSGEKTFWDRSTLYALRGLFNCGEANRSHELLSAYSKARLLGNHIPYAVEAYPEGNQAQLSAESGLYLRIFSEGILGIRPVGFNKFILKPSLPDCWDFTEIDNIKLCGKETNIKVTRSGDNYTVSVSGKEDKTIKVGDSIEITL